MSKCILCGRKLTNMIFRMDNMPSKVQHLPAEDEIGSDTGMTLNLYACDGCGLVQFDCEPVYYYKDVIRAVGLSPTMKEMRLGQYKSLIDSFNLKGKKVLEVGCGGGEFLGLWEGLGVSAFGVEHSEELVKHARDNGLDVVRGFVDAAYKDDRGPFDAFASFNYIEHQPDPCGLLTGVCNNLKDGGIGLVTVPSFDYSLEKFSYYNFMRDHIAYYTEDALKNLFRLNGFDVCSIGRPNSDTTLIIVRKRQKRQIPDYAAQRDGIGRYLNDYVSGHPDIKTVAVWGASHQGLTLLATLKLDFDISCIIDSSPMKWDRYSTVSHLKIVKPEQAYTDKPELVIITAPEFSKEIAGLIRERYRDIRYVLAIKDGSVTEM